MATFQRTKRGIGWLEITPLDLMEYSRNPHPVCGDCNQSISDLSTIVLIPLLNEAYCPECGKAVLDRMTNYPEDRPYAMQKERFWLDYFSISEGECAAQSAAMPTT